MEHADKIEKVDKRFRILGALFSLTTHLETIGDSPGYLGELTTKQWFLLLNLATFFSGPPTISQLAKQTGTSHQNVKAIAQKLQKKGYVAFEKDPRDGRSTRIQLCEKSAQYFKEHEARNSAFVDQWMGVLHEDEIAVLDSCLFRLIDQTEKMKYQHKAEG